MTISLRKGMEGAGLTVVEAPLDRNCLSLRCLISRVDKIESIESSKSVPRLAFKWDFGANPGRQRLPVTYVKGKTALFLIKVKRSRHARC